MNFSPFSFVRQSIDSLYQAARQHLSWWTKPYNHDLVLKAAMDLTRSKRELVLEETRRITWLSANRDTKNTPLLPSGAKRDPRCSKEMCLHHNI